MKEVAPVLKEQRTSAVQLTGKEWEEVNVNNVLQMFCLEIHHII